MLRTKITLQLNRIYTDYLVDHIRVDKTQPNTHTQNCMNTISFPFLNMVENFIMHPKVHK